MSEDYNVVIIEDLIKFNNIKDEWNELASQYLDEYFFVSHDWYGLWFKYFLKDSELYVITVYKRDKLVAIAPFIGRLDKIKRIPVNKLESIGNAYSPFRALMIDSTEDKQKLGSVLFKALRKVPKWDIAQIGPVYDGELYTETKNLLDNTRYCLIEKVVDTNWRLPFEALNYDEYLRARDKSVRQEIKRRNKKLEELGSIEIKIVKGDEAVGHIADYCTVYEKSWKQSEHLGPGFHAELANIAASDNNLLLALMYLDGVPIAAQYRILCGDKCYFLKTAYDSQYKRYSVGVILLNHVLKYLMNSEQVKMIDFGPGNETYKADWAEIKGSYTNFFLFNKTIKGALIYFAYTKVGAVVRRLGKESVN